MSVLSLIESQVEFRHILNGLELPPEGLQLSQTSARSLGKLTIAVVVMKNGFTVVGTAAPVDISQYSKDIGEKIAYQNAIQQLVSYFGFVRAQREHETSVVRATPTLEEISLVSKG